MSKGNMLLGHARGKVGSLVFSRSNGQQVVRARAEVVKNPRTETQLIQRIFLNTVSQAYSKMQPIVDHSFEGIKKGQDTMAYYMKQNVQFCREKIAKMQSEGSSAYDMYNFMPLGRKGFTPNQYLVSMGSLPQIQSYVMDDESQFGFLTGFSANTYESVINTLGLQRGDQLTFCLVHSYGTSLLNQEFKYCSVILDPTNADGSSAPLDSPFIVDNAINLPSPRNEGNFYFAFNAENQIGFALNSAEGGIMNFVIASRKGSDGNWLRSTSYAAYIDGANETYNLGECLDAAKEGTANPIVTSNELYLNNAGTSGGEGGEGSGSVVPVDPTPTPSAAAVTSATANGVNLVRGTEANIQFANGTSLPQQINVVVNTSNAVGKKVAVLAGNAFLAEATVGSNGVATIPCSVNSGITYKVCWSEDEEYVPTSYTFNVSVNSEQGGGGDIPGGFDQG